MDVSYTYANSYDMETNTRSTSTTFLYDPNNPSLSEGPSDNDIKHRVVGDMTYRLPFGFQVSAVGFWAQRLPVLAESASAAPVAPPRASAARRRPRQHSGVRRFIGNIIDLPPAPA